MATFNPELPPDQAPNFTSRVWEGTPIQQPAANQSTDTLLTGLGKGISEAFHGVDAAYKQHIGTEVEAKVDEQRDSFTSALNTYRADTGLATDTQLQQAKDLNLVNPNTQPKVPDAVNNGIQTIASFQNAANSGKISQTAYYGNLISTAKSLRAQYPGYRDYIDQKISEYSGVNPANAYMKSLIEDIDKNATNRQATQKEFFNTLVGLSKEGVPGTAVLWQNYTGGKYGSGTAADTQLMDQISSLMKDKYKATVAENQLKGAKSTEEFNSLVVSPAATQWGNDAVKNAMHMDMTHGEAVSPDQLFDTIQDHLSGKKVIPNFDQLMTTRGAQLGSYINQLRQQMTEHYTAHEPGQRSLMDMIPDMPTRIETMLKPMKDYADSITKGDFATALYVHNQTKALGDQDKYHLLTATDATGKPLPITEQLRKTNAIKDVLGPGLAQNFQINQLLQGNLMQSLKDLKMDAFQINGKPEVAQNHIDKVLNELPKDPSTGEPIGAPENIKDYMRVYDYLKDPKAPDDAKIRLAQTMFSQGNWDFMLRFKGAPSREQMFTDVLKKNTVNSLYKLGDNTTWNNVKDWAQVSFNRYIFREELANLRQITTPDVDLKGNPVATQTKVIYNNDSGTPSWKVDPNSPGSLAYQAQVQRVLTRLNGGISAISNISKAEKSDPEAFVLDMFRQAGIDLSNTQNIAGIPEQMLKAMAVAKAAGRPYRGTDDTADPFGTKTTNKNEDRVFVK